MKALSICQPWAWAILHAGKNVENRTWPTWYRGQLLIHAGKSRRYYDAEDPDDWMEAYGVKLPSWSDMPQGAIVGVATVVDCVAVGLNLPYFLPGSGPNVWAEGPWCWLLSGVRAIDPIPFRGAQGLFDVPDELVAKQLQETP